MVDLMAHTKPLGTLCTLSYDSPRDVAEGDVIRTEPTGTCYRVIGVRRQERGRRAGRWHLQCVRIAAEDVEEDDTIHPLYWYPRNRKSERRKR